MTQKLSDLVNFQDAQKSYSRRALWQLFDGTAEKFNIAHECVVRHASDPARVAVRIARANGAREQITFASLADHSAQFAHWLAKRGVRPGDRVAFMLDPCELFYVALFGTLRMGAIGVPLFTLFGSEGLQLRVDDCHPRLLITSAAKVEMAAKIAGLDVVVADESLFAEIESYPTDFEPVTTSSDLAVFQYTSGTTRELPAAVKHTHGALVVLMTAALYGTGIRRGMFFSAPPHRPGGMVCGMARWRLSRSA